MNNNMSLIGMAFVVLVVILAYAIPKTRRIMQAKETQRIINADCKEVETIIKELQEKAFNELVPFERNLSTGNIFTFDLKLLKNGVYVAIARFKWDNSHYYIENKVGRCTWKLLQTSYVDKDLLNDDELLIQP